jgi:hypothetical protein
MDLPGSAVVLGQAVRLLKEMRERGAMPDLVAYTAAMACCGKAGKWLG